jgi:hypothetical protein
MNILKEMGTALKGVLAAKVPAVMRPGYHAGERVEYIDRTVKPTHYGTVVGTWGDKVKIVFDGFENGTWLEPDEIQRYEQ